MSTRGTNRTHPDQTVPGVRHKTPWLVVADRTAQAHKKATGILSEVRPACAVPDMEYIQSKFLSGRGTGPWAFGQR